MNKIIFYEKANGNSQVRDWLEKLYQNEPKKYRKVALYLSVLKEEGLSAGEPYIKYLKKEKIWELRPNQDRILFFAVNGNEFVLLHQFLKKTQKTPTREITQAVKEKSDYLNRKGVDRG